MDIRPVGVNNQPQFGMAVKADSKTADYIVKNLTKNGKNELKELITAEKTNLTDVNLKMVTTLKDSGRLDGRTWQTIYEPQDVFEAQVGDKKFRNNEIIEHFSQSRAIIGTIKKAVKHARELTEQKEIAKDLFG